MIDPELLAVVSRFVQANGKEELLNLMPPYQGGGDMIKTVTLKKTIYNLFKYNRAFIFILKL